MVQHFNPLHFECRDSAKQYFEKSHDIEGLMDSLYHLEQYEELVKCIHRLPEKSYLLNKLGQMLSSVGTLKNRIKNSIT